MASEETENVDDDWRTMMMDAWLHYKLTHEPSAQVESSGELKIKLKFCTFI